MRVLHVVKTSDGARWAAQQAGVLAELGVEVHVVLPAAHGEAVPIWEAAGARIHVADVCLPVREPWRWPRVEREIRALVAGVAPDLVHTHFVTSTLALRRALGPDHPTPRLFQVPGPLHMEHALYRALDLRSAGSRDYWAPSSRYTLDLYRVHGAPAERLALSYYGTALDAYQQLHPTGALRAALGVAGETKLVGNISYLYPPKYYLGQTTGLKRHEDVIDALGIVCRARDDVLGVIVGGQWGGGQGYRARLQRRAARVAGERIAFIDRIPHQSVPELWADFDCALHLPMSENCGGVMEPLAARVPTVASRVGGLPEVVIDGRTGWLTPPADPQAAAAAVLCALANPAEAARRTEVGRALVLRMFDVRRTGAEMAEIYRAILERGRPFPMSFDSTAIAAACAATCDAHQAGAGRARLAAD